jgi:Flp pilus assembly protein TadG
LIPKLLKLLRPVARSSGAFRASESGNIAIWAAAAVLPLALCVGAATDFRRAATARSLAQDAADAAVLAAAKNYLATAGQPTGKRRKEAEAAAGATFMAHLSGRESLVTGLKWDLKIQEGGQEFTLASQARSPAVFGGLFGMREMPLSVTSSAATKLRRIELALVLDNTGSMAGRKLQTLKGSAKHLLDRLGNMAAESGDPSAVKVALVPFSMTVRVGAGYGDAAWMDREARSPVHRGVFTGPANRFGLLKAMDQRWEGCVESRPYPHDVRESPPSGGDPETLFVPYFAPDDPDEAGYANNYLPDGVVGTAEARQGYVGKYTAAPAGPGPNGGCSLAPVHRLTNQLGAVKGAVEGMVAVGNTNIPMGLAWGWHALSPNAPFRDGVKYRDPGTLKIVILMTDGQNNISLMGNHNGAPYSGVGHMNEAEPRLGVGAGSSIAQRRAALDGRLAELCQNMKREGIVIYTVRVETPGPGDVMRQCATSAEGFYDVDDVKDLTAIFDSIVDSVTALRISR